MNDCETMTVRNASKVACASGGPSGCAPRRRTRSFTAMKYVGIPVRRPKRRGFLLVELMVGLILLGIVATILPVTLRAVYQHRQQERFERLAQLELANQVALLQANSVRAVEGSSHSLSDWFQQLYPSAGLTVSTQNHSQEEDALVPVRITIEHRADAEQRPLRQSLTTWLIQTEEQP